jgi:hypothetical protein
MPFQHRRPIAEAPLDGTRLRLWGKPGSGSFVGVYSPKFFGWVELAEIVCPLIRHDVTHWAPADR